MHDIHSPIGAPAGAYEVDFAEAIDGPEDGPSAESYREAAQHFYRLMNRAFCHILYSRNPTVAAWQVGFALGVSATEGRSQSEVALSIGVTRAAISKGVTDFQRANNLPALPGQKSEASRNSYSDIRREQNAD